jgi:hypothetical protein
MWRRLERTAHDLIHPLGHNQGLSGRAGLIPQQSIHPFARKAFLPAPDAGLCLAGRQHDGVRAEPIGAQQHNAGPPDMLLEGIAVGDDRIKALTVAFGNGEGNSTAHASRLACFASV